MFKGSGNLTAINATLTGYQSETYEILSTNFFINNNVWLRTTLFPSQQIYPMKINFKLL